MNRRAWQWVGLLLVLIATTVGCSIRYANLTLRGAGAVVSAPDPERGPDLLLIGHDIRNDRISVMVTSVERGRRRVRWELQMDDFETAYRPKATFDEDRIYYVADDHLLALAREDGTELWEAPLSDVVAMACSHCLYRVDGAVAVISADGVLHMIDADSGGVLWTRSLDDGQAGIRGALAWQDRVVAVEAPGSGKTAVHVFTPEREEPALRIGPRCPETGADLRSLVPDGPSILDPDRGTVLLYAICEHGVSAQAVDLVTGEVRWRTRLGGIGEVEVGEPAGLCTRIPNGTLICRGAGEWLRLDPATGDSSPLDLEIEPGFDLLPLAEEGETLVMLASRVGTESGNVLWGFDRTTGRRVWEYLIPYRAASAFDLSEPEFYRQVDDSLVVLRSRDDGTQTALIAETLDLQTGSLLNRSRVEREFLSLDGVTWSAYYAYVNVGDFYAVDLQSGDVQREGPIP